MYRTNGNIADDCGLHRLTRPLFLTEVGRGGVAGVLSPPPDSHPTPISVVRHLNTSRVHLARGLSTPAIPIGRRLPLPSIPLQDLLYLESLSNGLKSSRWFSFSHVALRRWGGENPSGAVCPSYGCFGGWQDQGFPRRSHFALLGRISVLHV